MTEVKTKAASTMFRSKANPNAGKPHGTAGLRLENGGDSRAIAWLAKSGSTGVSIPTSDQEVLDVFLRMLLAGTIVRGAVTIGESYYTLSTQDAI